MFKTPNFQKAKTPSNLKVSNIKAAPQDLEERFNQFFERVIKLCKKCPINATTSRIISQLIGCGGSIPANYAEASEAMSKKDFVKSIKIIRKESKESIVWLRGLKLVVEFDDSEFDALIQEATEFIYILTSILKKTDKK
ncbi:MAG: hypothetical protein US60_C0001G0045 [Microgenomates group bacterium GW2011_GWC1_37_8]|uniref:Four helix bundle protein n=2 Tax=Candidatus Woeseibacteriota TaxID=1752722 RepID=A0A0G0L2Q3_9BACT|nr:MAG: hypothetical protein US60_C0001G0045 [Microgenomates group bacterium GW2011_GWC1_37_8]KKQ86248.1 MAG: hypothetical protein UT08_C0001G0114 [Candidatus Woesebacteria bacterium GW2011_GWB1_38_8]